MLPELAKIKGVHPGAILRRELKIQGLMGSELASSIDEYKQTISAILNQRRDINPKLSIKLANRFNVENDYFMLLQASYDVKKVAESLVNNIPNTDIIRKILFWDTDIDALDWDKNKKSIIKRILERGNHMEINEMLSFYGRKTIIKEVKKIKDSILPSFEENIIKYNLTDNN